ncbi:MAG: metallophosphoesterase family protein [Chloroflexota bacterium]
MTQLAVLADIHSNLPALDAVLDDLQQFPVDRIIVAGDVVNWGAFSRQVMERLAVMDCAFIRGNNELYLTDWQTPRMPKSWEIFTLPPYTLAQLGNRWMNVISSWPDTLSLRFRDASAIQVVHGSPRSPFEAMLPTATDAELEPMLSSIEATTIIAAHSHLAMDRQVGCWHVLNPGSVGNPLDGDMSASYMLLESTSDGWQATNRRVPFDNQRVLDEFERTGFADQCGVVGHLVVQEYRSARLEVLPFLEWWRKTAPMNPKQWHC